MSKASLPIPHSLFPISHSPFLILVTSFLEIIAAKNTLSCTCLRNPTIKIEQQYSKMSTSPKQTMKSTSKKILTLLGNCLLRGRVYRCKLCKLTSWIALWKLKQFLFTPCIYMVCFNVYNRRDDYNTTSFRDICRAHFVCPVTLLANPLKRVTVYTSCTRTI